MGRKVTELITILMKIEENFSRVYNNMGAIDGAYSNKIKLAAKILAGQELKHAERYKELLNNPKIQDIEITEALYKTTEELLLDFKNKIKLMRVSDLNEIVEFAVYYEKENGRVLELILNTVEDEYIDFIKLLKALIDAEKEHTSTLLSFVKIKNDKFEGE